MYIIWHIYVYIRIYVLGWNRWPSSIAPFLPRHNFHSNRGSESAGCHWHHHWWIFRAFPGLAMASEKRGASRFGEVPDVCMVQLIFMFCKVSKVGNDWVIIPACVETRGVWDTVPWKHGVRNFMQVQHGLLYCRILMVTSIVHKLYQIFHWIITQQLYIDIHTVYIYRYTQCIYIYIYP